MTQKGTLVACVCVGVYACVHVFVFAHACVRVSVYVFVVGVCV
jgi:hypothetical protein